ncbi:hypothetical protein Dimus_030496 [Dionaea muscipula]
MQTPTMESLASPHGQKQILHIRAKKSVFGGNQKDLWVVVREGSLVDVELALALVKKSGGHVNLKDIFGLTPLHIAVWRNHIPIVKRLIAAGADPNLRDGESGWSSLHRALHFGHLAVASVLLQAGASITLEDSKSRIPIDLLSGSVLQIIHSSQSSVSTEVFSWGSGANYQLGTGNAHLQKLPCILDSLHGSFIMMISAAKFHSMAVSARGELYTWGFGRGGRLGHPEFDIHSGQAAVITPRQVISGLGSRWVRAVAAAKHHSVVATESGEVFTWGSNREGQLGYTSVDTQPTPRRVGSLKCKIVAIAAANKHTAAVSDTGEVFTWGSNKEGQLGYGTSNSGSNYTPRLVEYLKGKVFTGVAAAKYHTIALGADGEVYTWGHRLVTPRRVVIARNLRKNGNSQMKFHRMERLHVVGIVAGMVHSMALTDDGALFYWVSSDPDLRSQQLYSLCGTKIVSISAGKFWSAAVTSTGDIYMWDGKKGKDRPPLITRLHGLKRATSVSVGETHMLIISSIYHPTYPLCLAKDPPKLKLKVEYEVGELDEGFMFDDAESDCLSSSMQKGNVGSRSLPSLKSLCEKNAAQYLVEPRNAIQLLEIADSLDADDLRKHCEDIVLHNLDYIFTVSCHAIASASLDILVHLEKLLDARSLEPWSYRRFPTPTATLPAVINSEEDTDSDCPRTRENHPGRSKKVAKQTAHSFLEPQHDYNQVICKQVRALNKKLQQIEILEAKQLKGNILDEQQIAKLHTRMAVANSLAELGIPTEITRAEGSSLGQSDGKGSKRLEMSRKQRRKSKKKASQSEVASGCAESLVESCPSKGCSEVETEISKQQEGAGVHATAVGEVSHGLPLCSQKVSSDMTKVKSSSAGASKKKSRKGGLSTFLSGGLDEPCKDAPPPPSPPPLKNEGPAWGGAKASKVSSSLREIQDEQKSSKDNLPANGNIMIELSEESSSGKFLLSSFLPSTPIPMVSAQTSQKCDGEKSTPPWSASGTSPCSRPSLRDIQLQQVKVQHSLSHSPKTRTAGFSVSTGQGSPSDTATPSRWFKPETDSPSSIRSIQIEEKAMKDLRRFYSNVKLVRNPS